MIHPDIPLRAISIMQPWSWLIVQGHKDIENRDWRTKYRGPVAIHAGKSFDAYALDSLGGGAHPVTGEPTDIDQCPSFASLALGHMNGGIVGVADIVDCVSNSRSPWFVGRYGFVIANPRPIEIIPVKGALGFFDWRKMLEKAAA